VRLADLEDPAKLADVINDFKRDMAAGREGDEEEHAKLMRRLGSRGLESFNPELHAPHKAK
jgi:homospermidine synthase